MPASRRSLRALAVPLAAVLLAACEMPWHVAGGSGTETSNGEIVAGRSLQSAPSSSSSIRRSPQ